MRRHPHSDPIADHRRKVESLRRLVLVKDSGPSPARLHETLVAEHHPARPPEYPQSMRMPNGSVVSVARNAPDELRYSLSNAVFAAHGRGSCGHQTCADADGHIDECRYREMEDA